MAFVRKLLVQKCPECGEWSLTCRRVRQFTFHPDDRLNWFTGCEDCRQRNKEYWDQRRLEEFRKSI